LGGYELPCQGEHQSLFSFSDHIYGNNKATIIGSTEYQLSATNFEVVALTSFAILRCARTLLEKAEDVGYE